MQIASHALGNNVRISTVGKVLPQAGSHAGSLSSSFTGPGSLSSSFAGALAQDPAPPPAASFGGHDDNSAGKLQHLMFARNALARSRIADGAP